MLNDDNQLQTDEEDQRVRSTKKAKMDEDMQKDSCDEACKRNHKKFSSTVSGEGEETDSMIEKRNIKKPISYKRMLLGVNGEENDYNSESVESDSDEEDSGEEMNQ